MVGFASDSCSRSGAGGLALVEVYEGAVDSTLPSITAQPAATTENSGSGATLSVAAIGLDLDYQWYRGSSDDTSNPISGATSATYLTGSLSATTSYWATADTLPAPEITAVLPPRKSTIEQ